MKIKILIAKQTVKLSHTSRDADISIGGMIGKENNPNIYSPNIPYMTLLLETYTHTNQLQS
jgi:hypothetical protein